MSFDVNVLSSKPVIKPASSMQNDGGGGNLGYMFQGRRQNDDETKNVFELNNGIDTFGKDNKMAFSIDDYQVSFMDLFMDALENIKNFLDLLKAVFIKIKDFFLGVFSVFRIK